MTDPMSGEGCLCAHIPTIPGGPVASCPRCDTPAEQTSSEGGEGLSKSEIAALFTPIWQTYTAAGGEFNARKAALHAAIERILADRLAAVEAERDEMSGWIEEHALVKTLAKIAEWQEATGAELPGMARTAMHAYAARAESAEAALATAQEALDEHRAHYVDPAEHAKLRGRLGAVEALADDWLTINPTDERGPTVGDAEYQQRCVDEYDNVLAVLRSLAQHDAEVAARALREAADAALTMYDPPVDDCIEWSEWLRARADSLAPGAREER